MPTPKQDETLGAEAGDDLGDIENFSFTDLESRLSALQEADRKRVVRRLSRLHTPEEINAGENVSNPSVSAQGQATVTHVTVENTSEKKLPRFSGDQPLGHGEVSYRKWSRCARR